MHPSPMDLQGRRESPGVWAPQGTTGLSQSASMARRLRSEDSWVEISSQPSSSSLSSAGDNEVITTGLSIQNRRRQRRSLQINPRRDTISGVPGPPRPHSANGSSQDEYDESESESDQVLSSSNEDIQQAEDDDDDDHTALGVGTTENNAVFTPQPNAFSHPPSSNTARSLDVPAPGSYFPMHPQSGSAPASTRLHPGRTIERPSYQGRPQTSHARPTMSTTRSSTHQADHDAALRASLTTLLSCAAAVRGSSKPNDLNPTTTTRPSRIAEPTTLRLVPESHFLGDDEPPSQFQTQLQTHSPTSPRSIASKRKARSQSKERLAKKTRSGTPKSASAAAAAYPVDYATMSLSPTLMTWMISAGVVLVFSAISFSAGYAWGKEVGRFEAGEAGIVSGGCGREAVRGGGSGLRRWRWSASTSVRA